MGFFTKSEQDRRAKAMKIIDESYNKDITVLDNLEKSEEQRMALADNNPDGRFFTWLSFASLKQAIGKFTYDIEYDADAIWKLYGHRELHTKQEALLWREILVEMGKITARINEIPPAMRDDWPKIINHPLFKENRNRIWDLLKKIRIELQWEIKFKVDNKKIDQDARAMVDRFIENMNLTSQSRK